MPCQHHGHVGWVSGQGRDEYMGVGDKSVQSVSWSRLGLLASSRSGSTSGGERVLAVRLDQRGEMGVFAVRREQRKGGSEAP